MSLDPLLARLIKITYKTDFAQLHTKSAHEVRKLVKTHHSNLLTGFYKSYKLPNGDEIKIFRPDESMPSSPLPLVFYGRGCGGIAPEPAEAKHYCAFLSKKLNSYIAVPSFRLAPEFKFPIGLNDGLTALKWLYSNDKLIGFDKDRIAVWGESSGANALAVICQLLRDEKLNFIKHQVLLYPTTDMVNHYPSKSLYRTGYLLEVNFLDWLLEHYLNHSSEKFDYRVSPLLNPNLSSLPSSTIITAEYDPTRDEAEKYGLKLLESGNQVDMKRFNGVTHGFAVYHKRLKKAREALDYACDNLFKYFKHSQVQ